MKNGPWTVFSYAENLKIHIYHTKNKNEVKMQKTHISKNRERNVGSDQERNAENQKFK